MPLGKKASSYRGAYRVPLFNYYVCVSVSVCNIRRFYRLRQLYDADFHKPGIYGSGRVWAKAWNVFPCMPSRGGHGRRAAVDFVVCFGWGDFFFVFFFPIFFLLRTHTACCKYEAASCLIYLSTSNEARPRERSDRCRFLPLKTTSSYLGAYRVPLFN